MKTALVALVVLVLPSFGQSPPATLPIVPLNLSEVKAIQEPCPSVASVQPERYMIAWNDTPGIDGSYIFVIHPTQVFLRSSHDNPNPDFVYWVASISGDQYAALVRFLNGYHGKVFKNHKNIGWWTWTGYECYRLENPKISPWYEKFGEAREKQYEQESNAAVSSNIRRILKELNRAFAGSGKKFSEKTSIKTSEAKLIEENR